MQCMWFRTFVNCKMQETPIDAKFLWLFLMGFYDFLTLGKCSKKSRNYSLSTDAYQTDVKTLVVIQLKCKWPPLHISCKESRLKNSCVIVKQDEIVVLFSRTICPSALHCIASRHCCNSYRKSMTLFDVSQPAVSYYMAYRQKKHQKKKGDLLTQGAQYIKKALKRINWNNLGRVLWNRH